jgi:hypothetical protein
MKPQSREERGEEALKKSSRLAHMLGYCSAESAKKEQDY